MQFRRPVDGRVEVRQRLLVGRHRDLMAPGGGRDPRERAAVDRHRVEVLFARVHLARGEEDLRAVSGQPRARDLPLSAGQRLRHGVRGRHVQRIEMHPAVALGEHQDALVVGQPREPAAAETSAAPAAGARVHRTVPDPRIVVQVVDRSGLSGRRVDLHQPTVVIVLRPDRRQAGRAILRAIREAPVHDARDRFVARLRALLVAGKRRRVSPQGAVLSEVQDGEQAPCLRVADVGTPVDHLGVGRFGDVVRHVLIARRDLRPLGHRDEHAVLVGGEQHVADGLPRARLEPDDRFRRAPAGSAAPAPLAAAHRRGASAPALLALFRLTPEMLDQLLFLLAEDALRFGQSLIGPGGSASSLSLCAALNAAALRRRRAAACRPARAGGASFAAGDHVGELHLGRRRAGWLQRHEEQVAVAHERHRRVVPRPARVRFRRSRSHEQPSRIGGDVVDHDIAALGGEQPLAGAIEPTGRRGRDLADLFGRELFEIGPVPADRVGAGAVLARLLPGEVDLRRIGCPPDCRRRRADQLVALHDVVDGEGERYSLGVGRLGRRRLRGRRR